MKFDFVIGNPPYQEETINNGRKNPIYNIFMDEAYKIADVVELITPARFLFDAGQTSKKWNEKMLNDEHFSVLYYESDGAKIFPNTDIKGGVAVTIRNTNIAYGKIKIFTSYSEINGIIKKINSCYMAEEYLDSIVSSRGLYRLTQEFFIDYPDASDKLGAGTGNMMVSNIFDKFPEVFLESKPNDGNNYLRILGRSNNNRVYRYVKSNYIQKNDYIETYNVILPKSNGSGIFGEILSSPLIAKPMDGATDTFISLGMFKTEGEAEALLNYIKSKFLRALLSVKKVTQDNPKAVWKIIPLQNFTDFSDIDWSASIADIDKQLYKKYKLSDEEINFIETKVKEMD